MRITHNNNSVNKAIVDYTSHAVCSSVTLSRR